MSDLGQLLAATETAVARTRAGARPTARRARRDRAAGASAPGRPTLGGVDGRRRRRRGARRHGVARHAPRGPARPGRHDHPDRQPHADGDAHAHAGRSRDGRRPRRHPAARGRRRWSSPPAPGGCSSADSQSRTGVDPEDATPDDYRTVVVLVSPAGERHPVLEVVSDRIQVGWFWWTAGQPMVLATTTDYSAAEPRDLVGLLDLRTGDLTPWPDLPTSALWIGGTRDGTTVWAAPQWDPADVPEGAVPMPRNVLGPQMRMGQFGPTEFRLLVRAADGTQRDLGPIDDSRYVTSLSPDGAWVSATAPDGALLLVDLRSGTRTTAASVPADRACTVGGWSGPHELLLSCGVPAELLALDATKPSSPPRVVGTSEHTVVDATPVGDGRVARRDQHAGGTVRRRRRPGRARRRRGLAADRPVGAVRPLVRRAGRRRHRRHRPQRLLRRSRQGRAAAHGQHRPDDRRGHRARLSRG